MTFSAAERRQLADLLLDRGPDAPTLCEGWVTRDLAAHLYVRENDVLSAAGMFVGPLSARLDAAMDAQRAREYDQVVNEWKSGPARWRAALDPLLNTAEHFVHHEDVRRGGGEVRPRELSRAAQRQLWQATRRLTPALLRGSRLPVILTPRDGEPLTVGGRRGVTHRGDDVVRVSGDIGELLLWAFGRDAVVVTVSGDVDAVSR